MNALREVFSFPNPVNEISARLVAGMVVVLSLAAIVTAEPLLFVLLAYGFVARVAAGPTLSPMGLLATRVIVPLLGDPSRNSFLWMRVSMQGHPQFFRYSSIRRFVT